MKLISTLEKGREIGPKFITVLRTQLYTYTFIISLGRGFRRLCGSPFFFFFTFFLPHTSKVKIKLDARGMRFSCRRIGQTDYKKIKKYL